MFISPAYAQFFGGGGDTSSTIVQMAPLGLIFVVFYFFMIRPQQKKAKDQRAMLDAIRRGDRVVTGGGIIGIVAKVAANDEVLIDIAENTRIRVLRSSISTVMAKPAPAGKADNDDDETKEIEVLPPAKDDQTP
ncbi:MAG TPA: preprotein translocase subunit YajC [Stellaceae bacterium]|jgi:preprotein translocase subunit YajC|nr:preprotein translocase subunit YajC [Stellaceae bacterium]